MHVHHAGAFVLAAQDDLLAAGEQQLAFHRVDAVVGRRHQHLLSGLEAIGIDEVLLGQRRRGGIAGDLQGFPGGQFARRTVAETQHPAEPGGHFRVVVHQGGGHRCALEEPEAMGQGEVGDGRLAEEEIAFAAGQLLFGAGHDRRPVVPGLLQRQAGQAAAAEQRGAIGDECLDRLGRQLGETQRHGVGLEHQGHGVLEHHRVHPEGETGDIEFLAFREQRRGRLLHFQAAGDQRGVAVDIGAHLQHRGLAVAPGEGGEIRLGHHRRNHHRTPGQLLEAQHQAGLLGEG
ncbi:hypothetical protein D9M70_231960 [compost metagenome]